MKNQVFTKFFVLILASLATVACSSHKLTMPKGKWQPINQDGFVPAQATRYFKQEQQEAVAQDAQDNATGEAQ